MSFVNVECETALQAASSGQSNPTCLRIDCGLIKQLCTLGYAALKNSKNAKVLAYKLNKFKHQHPPNLFASLYFNQVESANNTVSSPLDDDFSVVSQRNS